MSSERRYTSGEIETIFARAAKRAETAPHTRSDGTGLTLRELTEIGIEAGIPPELVAEAAGSLDRDEALRRMLWLPVGLHRVVSLERNPTEREWERLVADLRETFGATGRIQEHGGLRQWTNGNLYAFVEPTGSGYRLRMGTTKGSAPALLGTGVICLIMALYFFLLPYFVFTDSTLVPALVSAAGAIGTLGYASLSLPAWASTRDRQMAGIAERLTASMAAEALPPERDETRA